MNLFIKMFDHPIGKYRITILKVGNGYDFLCRQGAKVAGCHLDIYQSSNTVMIFGTGCCNEVQLVAIPGIVGWTRVIIPILTKLIS